MKGAPQHHRSGNRLHNQREAQKKVVRNQVLNIENVRQHNRGNYRMFFFPHWHTSSLRLIVVTLSNDQYFHSFLLDVIERFQVFFVGKNEYSLSGVDNPANGAVRCKNWHCTTYRILNCIRFTYINKNYITMFVSWCTTLFTMRWSFSHASDKWYRWCHEQCRPGQLEWTKKKIVFI